MQNVLVVGSPNVAQDGFLRNLVGLGFKVRVVVAEWQIAGGVPAGVDVLSRPDLKLATLQDLVSETGPPDYVCSNFEPCMLGAACLRESLGLFGFGVASTIKARDKAVMYQFLKDHQVRVPPFIGFDSSQASGLMEISRHLLSGPMYLKPALGYGNIGCRFVADWTQFDEVWKAVHAEAGANPWAPCDNSDLALKWVLCGNIESHTNNLPNEAEVEFVVDGRNGSVVFTTILEKLILKKVGLAFQENSTITPPLTIKGAVLEDLLGQINGIARAISTLAAAEEIPFFNVYAELRMDEYNQWYCLEFALRTSGANVPRLVLEATGVDVFHVAAQAQTERLRHGPTATRHLASYGQIIFSDYPGKLVGFERGDPHDGCEVNITREVGGYTISVPHSDYLGYVNAIGNTPSTAIQKAARTLRSIKVTVENNGVLLDTQPPVYERVRIVS